jgi:hypothetical protein
MSYSSSLNLHECPRKLQLYKLSTVGTVDAIDDSITFTFGHCVGLGIQLVFEGASEDTILWAMFQKWAVDLFATNPKQNKSFWNAVIAIQKFIALRANGFLAEYELVTYQGKPAVELSFRIRLPNGFIYRGHVDAVLRHRTTGAITVLEVKTSSQQEVNPATYKNSAQAIGYSIVLDVIEPELSTYDVVYLVYKTKAMEWERLKFAKSYLQRAQWIQELLLDADMLAMYDKVGVYPMHGENCISKYGKECEYLQVCTLSTAYLATPEPAPELLDLNRETGKPMEYQIELTIQDLIDAQLRKEL